MQGEKRKAFLALTSDNLVRQQENNASSVRSHTKKTLARFLLAKVPVLTLPRCSLE
jgi:hypothetical protein